MAGNAPKDQPPQPPDNTVRLWDVETGVELRTFAGHGNAVLGVAFSPDGRRALSASFDKTARLWDVRSGGVLRQYTAHDAAVSAVAFTPDGRQAVSGGWDFNLRVWLPP